MNAVYITRWSAWSPGLETSDDWKQWVQGKMALRNDPEAPALPFAPSLFKRRLSQLSRMALQTGHAVLAGDTHLKITFSSIYGEIVQQLRISQKLLDSGTVSPAHFSLSVFNTPVASVTILEKDTAGYAATFSGADSFERGLQETAAALLAGAEEERIYLYGDECLPAEYEGLTPIPHLPFSLALRLSSHPDAKGIPLPDLRELGKSLGEEARLEKTMPALLFLKKHILPNDTETTH